MSKPYLAAAITFLDRDSQEERAIVYPVTRIELWQKMGPDNPSGEPKRAFVISDDGENWIEVE